MPTKPTKRERRETAKKQRLEDARNQRRKRKARTLQTIVAVIVIVGLIIFGVWEGGKASREKAAKAKLLASQLEAKVNTAASAAGCDALQKPVDQGHAHISPPQTQSYDSNPPTSGPHYSQPLPGGPGYTGVLPGPVQNEIQVHNLEHGHIGIQYNAATLPADLKPMLQSFTKANDTWVFMAPRGPNTPPAPGFKSTLAFTAWARIVTCGSGMKDDPSLIKNLTQAFYDAYQNKAPTESIAGTPIQGG